MQKRDLGERIFELRTERGWSGLRLSKEAGISPTTVVHLETGQIGRPRLTTLRRLARAFGVAVEELRGDDPTPKVGPAELSKLPQTARLILLRLLRAKQDPAIYWDTRDVLAVRDEFGKVGVSAEDFGRWFQEAQVSDVEPEEPRTETRNRTIQEAVQVATNAKEGHDE